MHSSYDKDYYFWFTEQAGLLRRGLWQQGLLEELQDGYISARLLAAGDTGLAATALPEQCPFTLEQLIDEHFWPEL
jgi:hypothetical protein